MCSLHPVSKSSCKAKGVRQARKRNLKAAIYDEDTY
jgi:hypothetical protein